LKLATRFENISAIGKHIRKSYKSNGKRQEEVNPGSDN
jgi:hypothetical protein